MQVKRIQNNIRRHWFPLYVQKIQRYFSKYLLLWSIEGSHENKEHFSNLSQMIQSLTYSKGSISVAGFQLLNNLSASAFGCVSRQLGVNSPATQNPAEIITLQSESQFLSRLKWSEWSGCWGRPLTFNIRGRDFSKNSRQLWHTWLKSSCTTGIVWFWKNLKRNVWLRFEIYSNFWFLGNLSTVWHTDLREL